MAQGLSALDLGVLIAYLLGVVGMSFYLARKQTTGEDYFLAGRSMRGSTLAVSIMANQVSAVSLISAPAFVALREGGGLRWLQYELALPIAMLLVIVLLLPVLRAVPGSSIYAFAEQRFGRPTRQALAASFLLSRGLSLGVVLYASAIVVSQALDWQVTTALLGIGMFAVFYTSLGGLAADIWSDVAQFIILWAGTLMAVLYVLFHEGWAVVQAIPAERSRALILDSAGITDGNTFAFWPMLVGGLFLYMSYYGCDQSQAQRLLAARSDADARRALVINGLVRFPLVLTYCGLGLLLAGLLVVSPTFAAEMNGKAADTLVPTFMIGYLPSGFRGLLFAALMAAAMSSIDSALNSLAAVTLEDVAGVAPERQNVWLSRGVSLVWGLFAVASGLWFAGGEQTVLEMINQVGSAFYGPVLAVFVVGALTKRTTQRGALMGLVAGLVGNLLLARLAPGLSWLWWNPIGFAVAAVVAMGA
ncbi:MAG TPA: sodium/solute symporter, partial [Gemmatimonadaceae bacterium]|nr:sodium/solute symporter [Gemmatimonadaceae bacterium]